MITWTNGLLFNRCTAVSYGLRVAVLRSSIISPLAG